MKIIWKLFTIAFLYCLFVIELLPTILIASLVNIFPQSAVTISQSVPFYFPLIIVIEFGIFYMVGKKHDLKKSLFSSMVSIYFGFAIGFIIATVLTILIGPSLGASVAVDGWWLAYSFTMSLMNALSHLFTAIAGLAVSNMRHNPPTT